MKKKTARKRGRQAAQKKKAQTTGSRRKVVGKPKSKKTVKKKTVKKKTVKKKTAKKKTAKKKTLKKKTASRKNAPRAKTTLKKSTKKKATGKKATNRKSRSRGKSTAVMKKRRTSKLGRAKVTGNEKLFLLFKDDYHARQIFDFLRVQTVRELEQLTPEQIVERLSAPIRHTVTRIRCKLAIVNRHLQDDQEFAVQFQQRDRKS